MSIVVLPPAFINVRVHKEGEAHFRLWLPFFLLWPLLLVVGILALIASLLADLVLLLVGAAYHGFTRLLLGVLKLLPETRGTTVHVRAKDSSLVDVTIR